MLRKFLLNPVAVFLAIWSAQIFLYWLDIGTFLQQDAHAYAAIARLFGLSSACFIGGYFLTAWLLDYTRLGAFARTPAGEPPGTVVRLDFIRVISFAAIAVTIGITVLNVQKYGPLPFFSSFYSIDAEFSYLDYGSAKNVIFSAMLVLVILSRLETEPILRITSIAVYFTVCILYMTRGYLITGLLQLLVIREMIQAPPILGFTLIPKRWTSRHSTLVAFLLLGGIGLIMSVLGQIRTGTDIFKMSMMIDPKYDAVPAAILWVGAYVSFPLANMVNLDLLNYNEFFWGKVTLSRLVPPFLRESVGVDDIDIHLDKVMYNYFPNPINNVMTYNGTSYLDAGYWGVAMMNVFLGVVGCLIVRHYLRSRGPRWGMIYTIYVSALLLLFFENFFVSLALAFEVLFLIVVGGLVARSKAEPKGEEQDAPATLPDANVAAPSGLS
ncbi:MAG: O-antigen ligase [Planctomycetota bacterium]|nr:O-antigen ligase [Planctomycetota bacterium]